MPPKVAICQEGIIPGGRFRVILGMIEILNRWGIEPDILTFRLHLKPNQISEIYGKRPRLKFRVLPHVPLLNEYSIIAFNALLRYYAADYDLLINTSNSLLFLPENKNVLSYIFYPREGRLRSDAFSIHEPEKIIPPYSPAFFSRRLLRTLYRARRLRPHHRIVAMTKFTRAALEEEYPELAAADLPVIYPPVEIEDMRQGDASVKRSDVVSIGRFVKDKRQLEQIRLAARLPELTFHIVGFVGNYAYYRQCERLIKDLHLPNVQLHPNASHEQMAEILKRSRYFIHTLINEPFGITAVQAAAAGCLPLVHASGGQQEVVPYPQLQYHTLEEIPNLILNLENLDAPAWSELHASLYRHICEQYGESIFDQKMQAVLRDALGYPALTESPL